MLKLTYTTKSGIELADAVVVVTNIQHSSNSNSNEYLNEQREYAVNLNESENINFTAGVWRDEAAFADASIEQVEAVQTEMGQFYFNPNDVEGDTNIEKCYNYLLNLEQFANAVKI